MQRQCYVVHCVRKFSACKALDAELCVPIRLLRRRLISTVRTVQLQVRDVQRQRDCLHDVCYLQPRCTHGCHL